MSNILCAEEDKKFSEGWTVCEICRKSYNDVIGDMRICDANIRRIEQKIETLKINVMPKSPRMDKPNIQHSKTNDENIFNYANAKIKLDADLQYWKNELDKLQTHLQTIVSAIKCKDDIRCKIFVMRYVDKMSVKKIAKKVPCDRGTVYYNIHKILGDYSDTL